MIKEKIAKVIKERIRICEETQDNWGDGIEQCWKKYIEIITADIEKAITYFLHECTDEEFYWLSEAFEEISEKAQNKDLIAVWRSPLQPLPLKIIINRASDPNLCESILLTKNM